MCGAQLGWLGNRDFCCLEGHTCVSKGHDNKHRYARATPLAQAVSPFPALPAPVLIQGCREGNSLHSPHAWHEQERPDPVSSAFSLN